MKVADFLQSGQAKLLSAGIGTAYLDTLVLLEDTLHKDRSWIIAHPEHRITSYQLKVLRNKLAQRAKHEPLAYIRGFTEFYGRRFKVNKRVLEPRPESETMIDLLKDLATNFKYQTPNFKIADVGTGSGALGITAALELHNCNVDLFDIDANALSVAKHNCELHELRLRSVKRDLLRNSHKAYDVILANLPYVPVNFNVNPAAAREPRLAIFGGSDGLDVYRRLFEQISRFGWQPKYILTEALPPQHKKLVKIAAEAGFKLKKSQGFIQVFN